MLILWGIKKDNEEWQEEILSTQCITDEDLERIKALASADGFGRFRISAVADVPTRPDFLKFVV